MQTNDFPLPRRCSSAASAVPSPAEPPPTLSPTSSRQTGGASRWARSTASGTLGRSTCSSARISHSASAIPLASRLRGRRVAVRDDGHRGAHLLDIGVGESLPEAGSEDLRALPDGFDALHERRQRRFVGALLVDADPQRRKHRGQVGRDPALQPVHEQLRRFQAALALVYMRIRAVGDDRVDRVDHALREVGVRIAGCDDRHLRPHKRADRLQPVAVQVPCRLADARPVRRDQQPVQR